MKTKLLSPSILLICFSISTSKNTDRIKRHSAGWTIAENSKMLQKQLTAQTQESYEQKLGQAKINLKGFGGEPVILYADSNSGNNLAKPFTTSGEQSSMLPIPSDGTQIGPGLIEWQQQRNGKAKGRNGEGLRNDQRQKAGESPLLIITEERRNADDAVKRKMFTKELPAEAEEEEPEESKEAESNGKEGLIAGQTITTTTNPIRMVQKTAETSDNSSENIKKGNAVTAPIFLPTMAPLLSLLPMGSFPLPISPIVTMTPLAPWIPSAGENEQQQQSTTNGLELKQLPNLMQ